MTAVKLGQEAVLPHQVTSSSSRITNPFAPNGSLPQSAVASVHVTFTIARRAGKLIVSFADIPPDIDARLAFLI